MRFLHDIKHPVLQAPSLHTCVYVLFMCQIGRKGVVQQRAFSNDDVARKTCVLYTWYTASSKSLLGHSGPGLWRGSSRVRSRRVHGNIFCAVPILMKYIKAWPCVHV